MSTIENEDRLFLAIENLQQTVSNLSADLKVMATKQDDALKQLGRGTIRMDDHANRLRDLESTQMLHKGYFAILGTGLLACLGGIFALIAG